MTTTMFGMLGGWEIVGILAVVLVLFGAKKLPELAKGLGTGIKEFRKATREVNEDLQRAFEQEDVPPPTKNLPSNPEPEKTVPQSSEHKA